MEFCFLDVDYYHESNSRRTTRTIMGSEHIGSRSTPTMLSLDMELIYSFGKNIHIYCREWLTQLLVKYNYKISLNRQLFNGNVCLNPDVDKYFWIRCSNHSPLTFKRYIFEKVHNVCLFVFLYKDCHCSLKHEWQTQQSTVILPQHARIAVAK